jgi:predicted AlkP superfamily pyrophosphatase or phosphodiesterase
MTMKGAVLLISIDGFSAALFHDASVKIPTLRALAARGVAAAGLRPAFPSVTWPCHTTLVTGASPARHGILGNEVLDRTTGRVVRHEGDPTVAPIRAETLWDAAAAAGLATATLCWPKTRGVRGIRDNVPEFLEQALFEEWTSRPLWDEARALDLPIERYADWSASRPLTPLQDWLTLELTRHVVRRRPPDLLLTHFLMVDAFQHEFGPGSPEARWAMEHADGLVATLLGELASAGRLETTDVVVLGDHGFVPVEHRALPNAALNAAGLLEVDASGVVCSSQARVTANGGSAHVYVGAGRGAGERAREVLAAVPGVAEVLGPETFANLGLPHPAEDPTQGDLVLHAAEGWYFTSHATQERAAAALAYRGTHGHMSSDGRLHAAFLAAGPSIVGSARTGVLDQLDVAPTIASILGVRLAAAERSAAPSVLRRP